MPPVSRRVSAPAPRGASRAPTASTQSSGYRGAEGRRRAEEEAQLAEERKAARAASGGSPFRFYCPVGETRELVIVDDEPDFFRHEHAMKGPSGKWDLFTSCIAEHDNCPVCLASQDKPPYFAMYLTVIDLTPYVNRDNVEVPWSKKLLVVKPMQQKKITRYWERHKTLRGMVLSMSRDGEKEASIGGDIEFIEFMSEDDLETYVTEYTDKEGKHHEVIGSEPFDYEALFPEETADMLAAKVGGHVNDRNSHDRNIGRTSRNDWGSRSEPARRAAPARGRADHPDDGADEGADDQAPPRSARPASRAAPSSSRAAPAASRAAPRPAARPASRAEPEYDEMPEDAPEDVPQRRAAPRPAARPQPTDRPATSMADKRRALRGR